MKDRKFEFVPLCMLGYTFTLPADKIIFNRLGKIETLTFTGEHWVYQTGKVCVPISDHSEMDAILLGWYTDFDGGRASVTIKVRTRVDRDDWTWVQYKN